MRLNFWTKTSSRHKVRTNHRHTHITQKNNWSIQRWKHKSKDDKKVLLLPWISIWRKESSRIAIKMTSSSWIEIRNKMERELVCENGRVIQFKQVQTKGCACGSCFEWKTFFRPSFVCLFTFQDTKICFVAILCWGAHCFEIRATKCRLSKRYTAVY